MLYNSFTFLMFFVVVLLLFYTCAMPLRGRIPAFVLLAASLFFYGYYSVPFLLLLLGTIAVTYFVSRRIVALAGTPARKKQYLWLGVGLNVLSLVYFKYYIFIATNLALMGVPVPLYKIALPLGISFYTFQQIAYLVDVYRSDACDETFFEYLLFVTYFPKLISGPIVRREEIIPYLRAPVCATDMYLKVGLTLFVLGLAKKLLIADSFAVWADAVFNAADAGTHLTTFEAWGGALAYTIQIYFDFSGYSDMAIGVSTMCGVPLPVNFASPYKSINIVDFWRRWHITLSKWLRDYVYIPLGGNRCAKWQRYANAFVTMLIGGVWHGANWTFILWGAMHGFLQMLYQFWAANPKNADRIPRRLAIAITFFCIVMTWIPFRAGTFAGAMEMFGACFSFTGGIGATLADPFAVFFWIITACAVLFCAPNTNEILANTIIFTPSKGYPATAPLAPQGLWSCLHWKDTVIWAGVIGTLFGLCILRFFSNATYIYFQF